MPVTYQYLTDRTLVTQSAITTDSLIHVVIPSDISQNPAGSSYKAKLSQILPAISGITFTGGSSNCISDLYVSNIHSCSPLIINPLDEGNVYFGSTSGITLDVINKRIGINTNNPQYFLDIRGTQSRLYYDSESVGGRILLSGNTNVPRVGVGIPAYLTKPAAGFDVGMRAWSDTVYPGYGKVGDAFFYAGNETNGFNFLNPPGTGTEDYIRFYAGQTANGTTPDIHIQGSGVTRGYVGVGIDTPTSKLHVSGNTKIDGGLTTNSISATTYLNLPTTTNGYLPLSGGTVTGGTIFTQGVTANTLTVTGLTQTKGITSTGGITFPQITVNSNYTATTNDYMIDITGGTFNVQLPTAVGIQGKLYAIKNNGGGAVTVLPYGSEKLDDKSLLILSETNAVQLVSNGSQFVILGQDRSTVNNSTGVFEFTGMTVASPTTFTVAPVSGWIVDETTNPLSPQIYYVTYSGGTHTATYVTASTETWVYLTSGGTISQSNIPITDQQRRQNIALGKLGHANKTSIINAFSQPDFVLSPLGQLRDMFEPINLINGGIKTSANGANLSFNTSAGYLHGLGINFANSTLNPNSLYVSGTSPCTFQYRTQTGGTASNTTFINPTKYDVGGVATTLSGTKATNQRIYLVQNGQFRVQYGQVEYTNLAQAIAGLQTESYVEFSNFTTNGILIGVLSVLSSATDLTDTTKAQFFNVSKFGDSTGAAGGSPTTTLQQAYNNSVAPEITTNSTLGGLSVKNGAGTADNITNVFEGVNAAGTTTSFVRADGAISASTFSGTSTTMSGTKGTVQSNGSTTTAFLTFSGSNTVGGTGYTDFIRVTNTAAGATTPNKTFRVDSLGSLEIVNNAYNSTLFSLTDSGNLTVTGRVKSSVNYSQTGGGSLVTLGASVTPQTILSVNLTTYGNPVVICAYGDAENTSAGYWSKLQLWRDSTPLGAIVHTEGSAGSENTPFAFTYIDAPAAGTYTYYLKANEINGGNIKFGESTAPILNAREL